MRHEALAQQGLQSSSGGLPFRRINFVLAQRPDSHSIAPSVDLHPLNAEMPSMLANKGGGLASTPRPLADKAFFPESNVFLTWSGPRKAGSGLVNLGNTCFMNSVLQCLTHTPPLAELCIKDYNVSSIPAGQLQQNLDPIAATQMHIKRALTGSQAALQPKWHARNLKTINRRFRLGRQEDAHEYLRCVLDAMHEAFLKHIRPKPPPELAATTFVQRIFGGKLRSQIACEGVDYVSSTIDPFLDLSLEINKANSLAKALQHFTAAEILDGDNRYRCPKNNKLVRAHKRISIDVAPNVLTVHLKRFDFFGRGHKLSKKVDFDFELDLAPYMTHHHHKQQQQHHGHHKPVMYDLYAVLVHLGHSLHSGHYVCYVKAGNGIWHLCDDHRVAQVSQRVVEGQHAYILFYIKRQPKGPAGALPAAVAAAAQNAVVAGNKHATAPPQQQLTNSDASTKTPLAAGAVAAIAQGRGMQAAVSQQLPQQQQQPSAATVKHPANVSAAEGGQKVITSSTESTCTASPVPAQEPRSLDAVESPQPRSPQPVLHSHHYVTRSRPAQLSSFTRHLQLHQELVKLRKSRRRQRLAAAAVAAELHSAATADSTRTQQQQQCLGGQPDGDHSSTVTDLGVIGSKRQRQELSVQQPGGCDDKRQRVATEQQRVQHLIDKVGDAEAQQDPQTRRQLRLLQQQRHCEPEQQQQQVSGAQLPRVQEPSEQSKDCRRSGHHQQTDGTVTGAAALELVMAGAGSSAGSWEGGDVQLAAQASALQKVSKGKQRERDEWDAEYDRGRVKKVRKKEQHQDDMASDGAAGNRFQAAWDQQLPQKARNEAWRADSQQRNGRIRGHNAGFSRGGPAARRGRGGSGGGRGGGGRGGGGSRGGFRGRGRGGGGRGFRGRGGGGRGRGRGRGRS